MSAGAADQMALAIGRMSVVAEGRSVTTGREVLAQGPQSGF